MINWLWVNLCGDLVLLPERTLPETMDRWTVVVVTGLGRNNGIGFRPFSWQEIASNHRTNRNVKYVCNKS